MSSGDITVGGVWSCFVRLATTCLWARKLLDGHEKVVVQRLLYAEYIKYLKRICKARFPMKTIIVSERESLIGTQDSFIN